MEISGCETARGWRRHRSFLRFRDVPGRDRTVAQNPLLVGRNHGSEVGQLVVRMKLEAPDVVAEYGLVFNLLVAGRLSPERADSKAPIDPAVPFTVNVSLDES